MTMSKRLNDHDLPSDERVFLEYRSLIAQAGNLTRADITRFVKWAQLQGSNLGPDPFPLYEHLSDGFYRREVHLPKGHVIIGAVHTEKSYAIMMNGVVEVIDEDGVRILEGPATFTQPAGKQKIGYVIEDCIWMDVHRTDAGTVEQARAELFVNDYLEYDQLDYQHVLEDFGYTEEQARIEVEQNNDRTLVPDPWLQNFIITDSPIQGYGVFARRSMAECEIVGPARIGDKRTDIGRYTNHSAAPNVVAKVVMDNEQPYAVDFIATRPIKAGEEITVDYRQARSVATELREVSVSCQQSSQDSP